MAAVEVGGDRSVKWVVDVDHVRPSDVKSNGKAPHGHRQEGTDETEAGEKFEICIKFPEGSKKPFINKLKQILDDARDDADADRFCFKLPIADDQAGDPQPDQIRITWRSKGQLRKGKPRKRTKARRSRAGR
jgi:hypothetical protein